MLTLIAMLSPNAPVAPLFARSGEIAPFQTKSDGLVTAPDWKSAPAFGSISNDFPSIMGVTFVIALMYVLANLAVDLAYGVLDPQIRYS